jgi:hypothetical protein
MKFIIALSLFVLGLTAFAHDGGHGPKMTESGKFGGVLASVIAESDVGQGSSAKRVYKAELVRSEAGEVSLYIYDEKMNILPMTKFSKEASGALEIEKNKKFIKTDFKLVAKNNRFEGLAPKPEKRPFNIDIKFSEGVRKLFVAFDNLD